MPTTQTPAPRPAGDFQNCFDAVSKMESIADALADYPDLCGEAAALRKQLSRITDTFRALQDSPALDARRWEDPRTAARHIVEQLPLREVFQDQSLADAFLAELLLALARESSAENRKELQKRGIAQAKAQGVRFGAPKRPLPENFEEMRMAWRAGQFSLGEAAEACGMAKTTFYNAVQRVEKAAQAEQQSVPAQRAPKRRAAPRVQA